MMFLDNIWEYGVNFIELMLFVFFIKTTEHLREMKHDLQIHLETINVLAKEKIRGAYFIYIELGIMPSKPARLLLAKI